MKQDEKQQLIRDLIEEIETLEIRLEEVNFSEITKDLLKRRLLISQIALKSLIENK